MADIDWDMVIALAPELTTGVTEDAQDMILAHVNADLDASMFDGEDGPTFRLARIWLAAHLATAGASGSGGATGPVTSESVGGMSVSYGTLATTAAAIGTSTYGRLYLELVQNSFARLPLVI